MAGEEREEGRGKGRRAKREGGGEAQGWPDSGVVGTEACSGSAGAPGAGFAGAAFMRPGRKKVAGETLPVALTPPQPVERTATARQAAAEAKRRERALFMGRALERGWNAATGKLEAPARRRMDIGPAVATRWAHGSPRVDR